MEEELIDVPILRSFAGIDLLQGSVPDEIAILAFRHLLEERDLALGNPGKWRNPRPADFKSPVVTRILNKLRWLKAHSPAFPLLFKRVNQYLEEQGLLMRQGTIVCTNHHGKVYTCIAPQYDFIDNTQGYRLYSFMAIGIYYATTTGKTQDVAERLHALLSTVNAPKDLDDVADVSEFTDLDGLICGVPTWNTGADTERSGTAWDSVLEDIGALDLGGKPVAIFGLGDSSSYTDNFCDAMEELHSFFKKAGATMVGYVSKSDYTFDESKSVIGDMFCGLAIDEDSESDLTDDRLSKWAEQLKQEIPALS